MRYPLISYFASLGGNTCGYSKGPFIVIRTDLRGDEGIYQHELTHVKQWALISLLGLVWLAACYQFGLMQWANLGIGALALHPLLYTLFKPFTLWAEVQAYRKQIAYGLDPDAAAHSIANDYGINITQEAVLQRLK